MNKKKSPMQTVQVRFNPAQLKFIDKMIEVGLYDSRSEAVRKAVTIAFMIPEKRK